MTILDRSFALLLVAIAVCVLAQHEWQARDAFDGIKVKFDKVTADNCPTQNVPDLFLPADTVSHKPDIKEINVNPVFPNRTALLYLQNLALSRSFYWSYILQSRFIRPAINDTYDPGMMYYFLSTVADVSSNPHVNASAVYFSPNSSYSSSYRGFFNKTFPRFGPRTYRMDDFNDPIHLQKISTWNTFDVRDLGAHNSESKSQDYTNDLYKINEWYKLWLPDEVENRHDTKITYQVEIRYANNTNETFTFHGPPGSEEVPGPIKWTRPYFDCGRSNKWLIAAVVPIADIYPRHTQFRHIEYPKYTAVSVVEMDLERVDINQCPLGEGNKPPNHFAETARCKKDSTECEPLHGWGLRRGGYQCRCKPGYRLPNVVRRAYLGEVLERASAEQYNQEFSCKSVDWVQKLPIQWDKPPYHIREKYLDQRPEYRNYSSGPLSLHSQPLNIDQVLKFIHGVNYRTCKNYHPQDLILRSDVSYGAAEQFANEAKMAVRLANFISAFLQVSNPNEVFTGKRVADKPLTEDEMIGETLALVMGDSKIWSAGTYWERNKFTNRTYFAPYAYKTQLNTHKFKVEDLSRLNMSSDIYTKKKFFTYLKQRWSTNYDDLQKYFLKMHVRNNETGDNLQRYEHFPEHYLAANVDHGYWSQPKFDCNGYVKKWLVTYSVPFFGWDSLRLKREFKGVVAVSMDMLQLDINQCNSEYYTPNAFKNTHKCHDQSSYCVPIMGRGYETGGYKCECLQGYEYPFEDPITYYDGQLVEAEYQNIVYDKPTRYDMFKCRLAAKP